MSNSNTATLEPQTKNSQSLGGSSNQSMVVRLSSLDNMLELAGQVIIVSSNLNSISREIQDGSIVSHLLSEDVKDLAITSNRISSDLHNLVSDVRTVDMGDLFARFRRLARDTSRRLGKVIRFEVQGEEICIDKKTSEKIYDPIAHQIRNAISHGIEDKETRVRLGKDPVGTVVIKVRETENNTIIDVVDDGGGIDTESIRRTVAKMGLSGEQTVASMSDEGLYEYLYLPGFSTIEKTSTTSGRGVGLDVVRSVMNELNGETKIISERDKGTTFSFVLPNITAVNIADALMISAGRMTFAFPIASVIASQAISTSEVTITKGRYRSIVYLGKVLPLFDLLEIFGEPAVEIKDEQIAIIIIEYKHKRAAYIVSDFLNPQKIVISEFDEHMAVPGLVGTAILSGRKMGLVVDLAGLFAETFGSATEIDIKRVASPQVDKGGFSLDNEETSDSDTLPSTPTSAEESEEVYEDINIDQPDSAFLKEVESMLKRLNRELLTLEEERDKKTSDGIFRLLHSIKGNLTMYGAEQPASITHKIETILEKTIRGVLELDEDVFDVLFDGSVYLEDVVKSLLQGQKPESVPDKLVEGIEKFEQAEKAVEKIDAVDLDTAQVVLDATGEFYLSSRRRDGAVLQQCRIEFDSCDQPRFLLAYLILRRIQRVADVLGSFPAMSDIESGLCESGLIVLIAPRDSKADLIEKLGKNLKRYYGVTRFDAATFA